MPVYPTADLGSCWGKMAHLGPIQHGVGLALGSLVEEQPLAVEGCSWAASSHSAQGLEPSDGTNCEQHNLFTSLVVMTGTRGGGWRVCILQVRVLVFQV